ncbi:phosphoribosyl-ATP diphosphatase [Candidatus Moduliflexus flocculans]|uniref:Histidine biosynthesis bifunctional protein HisIE n=1 Tax=Candidatus Moduliflexus flocculans TaxID=1499966 RepID=A0A0S6VSH9_9BACT|nr:phosphoribosyl-ATP diphosphatase [Candidatus Moduliflexus flocculans]
MVIASIDIMQGKVVQLRQGSEKMLERDDALALAAEFDKYGEIAVIDLDAAMGKGENVELMKTLVKRAECRVGGGIRSVEKAKEFIALGARKVIIGSTAFENNQINHAFLQELVNAIGRPRIIVAVDALEGKIVTRGWKHQTDLPLFDAVKQLEPYTSEFLFTCVEREGTMKGANFDQIRELKRSTKRLITAAGGVSTVEEIKQIAEIGADVQLGMALYTGKVSLTDAFIECLAWQKMDLIPAITQDEAGQVLMVAYCSKEALRKAFNTGNMTYFSRSRQNLWTKGETSGHTQKLVRMRTDCDQDALLVTVKQTGAACHLDTYSCFGDQRPTLQQFYAEESAAIQANAARSEAQLQEQLRVAGHEFSKAATPDSVLATAADVFDGMTALLAKRGVSVEDVLAELGRRKRA